jgi:hypothetical protein
MTDANFCADAELVAAGVEFRILRDRLAEAKAQDALPEQLDEITDAMDPVFNRIMALPATSMPGLAVKAEIVKHYYEKGFNESFDAGAPWDDLGAVGALVEAVSDLAARSSLEISGG